MKSYRNPKKGPSIAIPLTIMILIASCMIFLMQFTNSKFEELMDSGSEGLLIHHDPSNPVHQELADKILEFRPEACKLIEVYSSEFEEIFSVRFKNGGSYEANDLASYTELVDLLKNNAEGHTVVTIDDTEEDVYFQWIETSTGEPYLVMIYMYRPIVHGLWAFTLVCYLVIAMVFVLIVHLMRLRHTEQINHYQSLVDQSNSSIQRRK